MAWVLLDSSNTVVNIISYDGVSAFTPPGGETLVQCTDNISIGWKLKDGVGSPPVPSLDGIKSSVTAQIDIEYASQCSAGYPVTSGPLAGHSLQVRDAEDKTNWLILQNSCIIASVAGQGSVTLPTPIRTTDNVNITVTVNEALFVLQGMAAWGAAKLSHSWTLKDAVKVATTVEAVQAIDIKAGW